jgi:hypothetical protein
MAAPTNAVGVKKVLAAIFIGAPLCRSISVKLPVILAYSRLEAGVTATPGLPSSECHPIT